MFRIPPDVKLLLEQLRSISDPYTACISVIDLIENHYRYEVEEPDKFDPDTGKPVSFKFRPGTEFEYGGRFGNIYLGGSNLTKPDKTHIRLHPEVEEFLIETQRTLIECKVGKYAFIYSERDDRGEEHGGGVYYSTRRQIDVYKLVTVK